MSQSPSFVLSEEEATRMRNSLWAAESILRLLKDHAELLINAPGELHSLDGFPETIQAAVEKVGLASDGLEPFHLRRLGREGVVLPARAEEAERFQRREVRHA